MKKNPTPEWSFLVSVEDIGNTPATYRITANADQMEGLAHRFDVNVVENAQAMLVLTRVSGGRVIHVQGTVSADIHQNCVVTLEDMVTPTIDTFDAYFADPAQAISFARARADMRAKKGEVEVEMIDESDAPEEIVNGQIDLGEVAAQFLSLAINPYPRAEHAETLLDQIGGDDSHVAEDSDAPATSSPFAKLKDWKDGLK